MPELRIHQPLPEVDTARLRPAVRQRPRLLRTHQADREPTQQRTDAQRARTRDEAA